MAKKHRTPKPAAVFGSSRQWLKHTLCVALALTMLAWLHAPIEPPPPTIPDTAVTVTAQNATADIETITIDDAFGEATQFQTPVGEDELPEAVPTQTAAAAQDETANVTQPVDDAEESEAVPSTPAVDQPETAVQVATKEPEFEHVVYYDEERTCTRLDAHRVRILDSSFAKNSSSSALTDPFVDHSESIAQVFGILQETHEIAVAYSKLLDKANLLLASCTHALAPTAAVAAAEPPNMSAARAVREGMQQTTGV